VNLILIDISNQIYSALYAKFWQEKEVSIYNIAFEKFFEIYPDIKVDCVVSPANSFGLMDGGFDKVLIDYFGIDLMIRVQQNILNNYFGEQPVGTSFIIETNNSKCPYLVHTPTMRVPMDISKTDNVYNAMRSMLIETTKNKNINTVLCPGLGTLTGNVNPIVAAHQMYQAYKSIINPIKEINWKNASLIQNNLRVSKKELCTNKFSIPEQSQFHYNCANPYSSSGPATYCYSQIDCNFCNHFKSNDA
jgi:O-acetyl-ADP-ribose deacetylase (regulator of RNase III)